MAGPGARSRDLLVAGHVVVDRYLGVRRFPAAHRTEPVLSERAALGGTATNLAVVAARQGLRVGLLSRVGDGFPAEFRRTLARARIDLRGLERVAGTPTPTCTIVEEPAGATRMLFQQGPMGLARDPPAGSWWREYRWLHLATGDPRSYVRLARAAKAGRQHVTLDPAQEIFYRWDAPTLRAALPFADLLFGNRAELELACRWAGRGTVEGLLARVPLIVRTEGADGASAFFRGGSIHARAHRPRRRRTFVGAGDAFRGGFYAGWLRGAPLKSCLDDGLREATARIERG